MPGATPYVLVEERSVGGKQSKGRHLFRVILSIISMVFSGVLFVHGVLSLVASHSPNFDHAIEYSISRGVLFWRHTANFSIRVLSAYFLIMAILFFCVELKSTTILTAFAGMVSPLGRGVVYTITGLLVFGTVGNWGLIFGTCYVLLGICHIAIGFRSCRTFYEEGSVDNGSATVTRTTASSESSETYTSSGKNFCRSCGASLRPGDSYCPDCSAAV